MNRVCIVTPITEDRCHLMDRLFDMVYAQDYPLFDWVVMKDNGHIAHYKDCHDKNMSEIHWSICQYYNGLDTIGSKLNRAIKYANADIICRFDSDDNYSKNWVSKSVSALLETGANIVGLSNALFMRGSEVFEYTSPKNAQLYLCGATISFKKEVWERKPFPEVTQYKNGAGEDTEFISNNGRLHCHGYKEGFLATIHGSNTSSHGAIPLMKKLPANEGASIIKRFY